MVSIVFIFILLVFNLWTDIPEDMSELFRAAIGDSNVVALADCVRTRKSKQQWKDLTRDSRVAYLTTLGLPEHFAEMESRFPHWILKSLWLV